MESYTKIETSVIIPVFNEEKYIKQCVQALLKQDYPKEKVEYIFVDGDSTDMTVEVLNGFIKKCNNIRLLHNPNRTVPYSMNKGIDNAKGEYIVRIDAHSSYAVDYISKCIEYLKSTGADNVGGPALPEGTNNIGKAIAHIHESPFGLGGGKFRYANYEGYVDTVFLGAFKRSKLLELGKYDVRLTRNQDIELNARIKKSGGSVYLTPNIKSIYYCRDSIKGLIKQNYQNGKWNIYTYLINKSALSIRHFIPLIFVLSIVVGLLGSMLLNNTFATLLMVDLVLYFLCDIYFSLKLSIKHEVKYFYLYIIVFFMLHLFYGIGSLNGILTIPKMMKV